MTNTEWTTEDLDAARDRVLKRWHKRSTSLREYCVEGHNDCSYTDGGPCVAEAEDKELARTLGSSETA